MTLSSDSFLDTTIMDSTYTTPVFALETTENRTALYRCYDSGKVELPASVRWPTEAVFPPVEGKRVKPPVASVILEGQISTTDVFFKKGVLDR